MNRIGIVFLSLLIFARSVESTAYHKKVDAILKSLAAKEAPGCILEIIQDGKTIYQRGYGSANLDYDIPLTPDSIFYVASNSKQFTAFSIALLMEQGKLSLDDRIVKFFPELPAAVYGGVTVSNLIYHTSGIRDYWLLIELAGGSDRDSMTNERFLNLMSRQKQLTFYPGSKFEYSNSGYVLLAMLVQRVSGESLPEFAAKNIFKPLGMQHTFFRTNPSAVVKGRATGYNFENGAYKEAVTEWQVIGDGGLMTTLGDLLRWDQNFYHNQLGKESPDLIRLMETPGKLTDGTNTTYAFGLGVSTYKGLKKISHNGIAFGYKSDMVRFPDQKFSVIALCNSDGPNVEPWTLRNQIVDIYLARYFKSTVPADAKKPTATDGANPIQLDEEQLKHYIGTFKESGDGQIWKLTVEDGVLMAAVEGIRLHLQPLSPTHFRAADAPQSVDLYFADDPSLQPKSIRLQVGSQAPSTLEPISEWILTTQEIAEYEGDYYGGELDATFRIYGSGGKLYVARNHGEALALVPDKKDHFEMGRFKLNFERSDAGAISAFSIVFDRLGKIPFIKNSSCTSKN